MKEDVLRTGQVVGLDGLPIPDARVVILDGPVPLPEIALVTDEAGRFSLALPPGQWTLRAHGQAGTGETVVTPTQADEEIVIVIEP